MEPCYPCIKSKEFFINIKIELKFVGRFGRGQLPPMPPPGSGTGGGGGATEYSENFEMLHYK